MRTRSKSSNERQQSISVSDVVFFCNILLVLYNVISIMSISYVKKNQAIKSSYASRWLCFWELHLSISWTSIWELYCITVKVNLSFTLPDKYWWLLFFIRNKLFIIRWSVSLSVLNSIPLVLAYTYSYAKLFCSFGHLLMLKLPPRVTVECYLFVRFNYRTLHR